MKQPVDHIQRPRLPWRAAIGITECGLDASKVSSLSREEYFQRVKDLGSTRSMMLTCMTCAETARNWKTWDDDPRRAIGREVEWETRWSRSRDNGDLLHDELTAIAALIEAHPDEFAALVSQQGQRREWIEKKKALAKRPVSPPPPPFGGGL